MNPGEKPDVIAESLELERRTGCDSIPTILEHYGTYENPEVLECAWPGCGWRTRSGEAMWRHVHFGPKHATDRARFDAP